MDRIDDRGFKPTVTAALQALTDRGDRYRIAGMLWMQGESDSAFPQMAAKYQSNLTRFIDQVRRDFAVPELPFVIGRIYLGRGSSSVRAVTLEQVRTAQVAVAERDPHAAWVDLDGLPQQDVGVEFNGPGTIAMGRRFATAMHTLRSRAAPPPSAAP